MLKKFLNIPKIQELNYFFKTKVILFSILLVFFAMALVLFTLSEQMAPYNQLKNEAFSKYNKAYSNVLGFFAIFSFLVTIFASIFDLVISIKINEIFKRSLSKNDPNLKYGKILFWLNIAAFLIWPLGLVMFGFNIWLSIKTSNKEKNNDLNSIFSQKLIKAYNSKFVYYFLFLFSLVLGLFSVNFFVYFVSENRFYGSFFSENLNAWYYPAGIINSIIWVSVLVFWLLLIIQSNKIKTLYSNQFGYNNLEFYWNRISLSSMLTILLPFLSFGIDISLYKKVKKNYI